MDETGMIAATSALRPGCELRAGALDALSVSIVLAPQQSVVSLLLQAASGQAWGPPAGLLAAVRDGAAPAGAVRRAIVHRTWPHDDAGRLRADLAPRRHIRR